MKSYRSCWKVIFTPPVIEPNRDSLPIHRSRILRAILPEASKLLKHLPFAYHTRLSTPVLPLV